MIKIINEDVPSLNHIFLLMTVDINTLLNTGEGKPQFLEPPNGS
jgi:hypothetical protein